MGREEIEEILYMLVDIVIYMFAIISLVLLSKTLTKNVYAVGKLDSINTTITQVEGTPDQYEGYVDSCGNMIYEGTLSGACVMEDILSMDEDLIIEINGSTQSRDDLESFRTSKRGRARLKSLLDMNALYLREYKTLPDGSVLSVNFVIM